MNTEEKEIVELLKPRVKVISPMPLMRNEVGIYLNRNDWSDTFSFGIKTFNDEQHFFDIEDFKAWPCIFKLVEWWEDRDEDEMPMYLKCIKTPDQMHFPGEVYKVEWKGMTWARSEKGLCVISTNCYLPATKEEFEAQKQEIENL